MQLRPTRVASSNCVNNRVMLVNRSNEFVRHQNPHRHFIRNRQFRNNPRPFSSSIPVFAIAKWNTASQSDYYRAGTITFYNMGDVPIKDPQISFILNNGRYNNSYGLMNLQGPSGGRYTANLVAEKNVIQPHSSLTVSFGIDSPNGIPQANAELPHDFEINGQSLIIDDSDPPTVPQHVEKIFSGPTHATIKWSPSFDNTSGIYGYNVYYGTDSQPTSVIETSTNTMTLMQLEPDTNYFVEVSAIDFGFNESERSPRLTFRTDCAPPQNPGNNNILQRALFVDATSWPTPSFGKVFPGINGIINYYLGFVVAGPYNDTGNWGGFETIANANTEMQYSGDAATSDYLKDEISEIRRLGGDVAISFGGAAGRLLEQAIPDVVTIVDIYTRIINNYGLNYIDFDIEGGAIADVNAMRNHIAAVLTIRTRFPNLGISYTLPVEGSPGSLVGFATVGENLLTMLHDAGIYPDLINGMTMEFGNPPNGNLYEGTVLAVEGMFSAIRRIFGDVWNDEQVRARIGICPMFGVNNNGFVFTVQDQARVVDYANTHGIGSLTGWDAVRDITGQPLTQTDQAPGDFGKLIAQFNPSTSTRVRETRRVRCV